MRVFAPSPRLAPFVRAFEVIETQDEMTHTLLPGTGLSVGFRYGGYARLLEGDASLPVPDSVISGLRATARRMNTSAGGGMVLAKFHEGGAAQFFDVPLHELFGSTLALEQLVPHADVDRVSSRIAVEKEDAQRIAAFETFLLARLRPAAPDALVLAAVRAVHATFGAVRIGALASQLHISQDALEKRFRRVVGTSPKRLASIVRIRHALQAYRPGMSLSLLSLEAGYYDQSHFIRELRAITGEAPQRFLRQGEYW